MQNIRKEQFKESIKDNLKSLFCVSIDDASQEQLFYATSKAIQLIIINKWINTQKIQKEQDAKIVYYMSMEFLMGRALGNNIINLKENEIITESIKELGLDLNVMENQEPEPALGNGGLGRLAACFLDSLATLGYPAMGCGIRYKYGMFKQQIKDGFQVELPDDWLRHGYPFEIKKNEDAVEVKFGGYSRMYRDVYGKVSFINEGYQGVIAVPYDIPIVGYNNDVVNTLRVWDAEAIFKFDLDAFDKGNYVNASEQETFANTICSVLYPNDNNFVGKRLRLTQQYFFVSATVQRAIKDYLKNHDDLHKLSDKIAFQMNDTHPSLSVAELMRILVDDYFFDWDDAWEITQKTCAYTNHTIMSEALEKWDVDLFKGLLPRVYEIIEEINKRFCLDVSTKYPDDYSKIKNMAILYDNKVRMANLAIVGSHSVNGVAELHTEILKNQLLKDFYIMTPEKFSNKTNGITQRRFLLHGNPLLATWVTNKIGNSWITGLQKMNKLVDYADEITAQNEFMDIKHKNKIRLAEYIKEHNNIDIDTNSIFDVHVKRLHEYKRQLLNVFHIMYLQNKLIENPNMEFYPRTFIFGAKASAGYMKAKSIIKLINCVADRINSDTRLHGKLKVVFIENYNVSIAEIIVSAADVSEQISTASKEASGTSNMKFMLNGAITLGTMDGANVEIIEEVGKENAVTFGLSSQEVLDYEKYGGYFPKDIYDNDIDIQCILNQLINGYYYMYNFNDIYNSLLSRDDYFILKDFRSYVEAQEQIEKLYKNKSQWAKSAILNTAKSGKFSSDRTIQEYVDDIWHLEKLN